jgi:hypothetical protein
MCAAHSTAASLQTLFLPIPDAILQAAPHLRLLDTIQTPEFNGQTHLIEGFRLHFNKLVGARPEFFPTTSRQP